MSVGVPRVGDVRPPLDVDPAFLTDAQVEDAIRDLVTHERALVAARARLVAEAVARGLPEARRCKTTGTYLRGLVRCSAGEGRAWAHEAEQLVPTRPLPQQIKARLISLRTA